jgi:hypothetical protein
MEKPQLVPTADQITELTRMGYTLGVRELYKVLNTSKTFGSVVGYYISHHDATAAAAGQGEWGSAGEIVTQDCLTFTSPAGALQLVAPLDSLRAISSNMSNAIARSVALKKLTPEERTLLGV